MVPRVLPRLILASRSPRRGQLLREAGYQFEQMEPGFDDAPHPTGHECPEAIAMALARRKARSAQEALADQGVVIVSADTLIVHADGSLAGTPLTREEARMMIRQFFGQWHTVVTGVALLAVNDGAGGEEDCFADAARVWVGRLGEGAGESYLDLGTWRGKAGGYNLFERQAAGWPIRVEGDPTTVVGLPMAMLTIRLQRWYGIPATAK